MVYSHNRYGYYVRSRAVPTNPNTSRQQAVRLAIQTLAQRWSAQLSDAQRSAWNTYGDNVSVLDKIGNAINLSGFNWYVGNNALIDQLGGTYVDDGPVIFTRAESDTTFNPSTSEATQLISVAFDTGLDWVGEDGAYMAIFMSIPQGEGRTYLLPRFRFAGQIDGDSVTPPTSPQTISVPWAVTEDQKTLVQGRIVRADGRTSPPFLSTVPVAA